MYISSLTIRNYRNFKSSKFKFKDGINTVIGENGSGKTNLFQALRILIDDSLPRNYRLFPGDFNRTLDKWNGHWIIITVKFSNLDNSEEVQTLAIQGTGQVETDNNGSYYYYFRPKYEFRKRLYDYSREDGKTQLGLNQILDEISIDDYESFFRGRGSGDFSNENVYEQHVGNFTTIEFPDPDNEDSLVLGTWLPREINIDNEISCTFIKALRDVENDLKSYKTSPLLSLLRGRERTVEIEKAAEITGSIDDLNEKIGQLNEIKDLEKGIDKSIKEAVGSTYAPNIELRSELPNELDKLFQSLKLWVGDPDDDGYRGRLWELSLGGANLIYLSLKLLEYEKVKTDKAANFLLIEEPEAHIHTHIQKTLFDNLHKNKTQIIVSTHSTHISSVSKINSVNIISRNKQQSSVFDPTIGLSENEILRIERYLDAVRSNLLFAKGVILVEGDAEQILIPKLFQEVFGLSLDEIGVSIVNIGSTGFKNIGRLFHQDRIDRKCSIITDLDSSIVDLPANPDDDTNYQKHCRDSQKKGAERKVILDEFINGNDTLNVFYSQHTFEISFVEAGNLKEIKECVNDVYSQPGKRAEVKTQLNDDNVSSYGEGVLRLANKHGKGWFALLLTEKLNYTTVFPDYILKAIAHSSPYIGINEIMDMALFRLKMMSNDSECPKQTVASDLLTSLEEEEVEKSDFIDSYVAEFQNDNLTKLKYFYDS
ncbi:AAA family ATPase [Flammeovirga yaeyamensis]|uniref:AAA family ATPase n=1 Tax=Flammeovirga yaeyamensis TaxID=367791 RepID=A0AAX1NAP3_9BACT|nr:AAA family ATPase [Flammeovirga yaeyamensis]MBB3697735.1 putative ATP-dependent endonuclease of OLD family [Flammeovirga yaeyamensis]NMF35908.1 AAA family ATPase [Flammeovirga yaeyamensis]QWG03142.1 AAA family ATPase [Flammeovirga yaeyamensis]